MFISEIDFTGVTGTTGEITGVTGEITPTVGMGSAPSRDRAGFLSRCYI